MLRESLKTPRHGQETNEKDYSFHWVFIAKRSQPNILNGGKIAHLFRTVEKNMVIGKVVIDCRPCKGSNYDLLEKIHHATAADNLTDHLLISREIEEA